MDERAEYLANLESIRVESDKSYDKALTALSSGCIATTLLTMKELRNEQVSHEWMIYFILTTLGISLVVTILSFLVASNVTYKKIESVFSSQEDKSTVDWVLILNYTSGVAFLLGFVFLGIFVSCNFHASICNH